MNEIIISCDQAGNTGVTISKDNTIEELHLILSKSTLKYNERMMYIKEEIHKLIKKQLKKKDCNVHLMFEDTQLKIVTTKFNGRLTQKPQNVDTFKKLNKLLGILENLADEKNYDYDTKSASEWRSPLKIKGKKRDEKKANAIKFVKKIGINLDNYVDDYERKTDVADSICMCIYKMKQLGIITRYNKVEINPKLKLKIHKQK